MIKKRSLSLLSILGLGVLFGITISSLHNTVFSIPFEREWITFSIATILVLMAIWIIVLWVRTSKETLSSKDVDELALQREKLAYKFMGATTLYIIVACAGALIASLEVRGNIESHNLIVLLIIAVLFIFGLYAQFKALKYHNKYNPDATITMKRSDGYENYFNKLDEGEKFKHYRMAYKAFRSMNTFFPLMLIVMLIVSMVFTPQFIAIAAVGVLWFIMSIVYYREGYKTYK